MDADDLVTIYTVSNAIEAEIIKNALEDEGIQCEIEGGHQAGEAGLIGIEIKLQVRPADAERATAFIKEHEHHHGGLDDDDNPDAESDEIQDLGLREGRDA